MCIRAHGGVDVLHRLGWCMGVQHGLRSIGTRGAITVQESAQGCAAVYKGCMGMCEWPNVRMAV